MELLNYKIYSETGTISFKKPIMVCIHGLGGGYANWVFQVRYLKKEYDLVLIELPSHGRSLVKMSELELSFDAVSTKIMEVLDHLGVEKASFAGVSLGTLCVKHIVLTYPERVDKYILIGPIGKYTFWLKSAFRIAMLLLPIAPLKFVIKLICRIIMPFKSVAYGRNLFMACAQHVERDEFIAWGKVIMSFGKIEEQYFKTMKEEPNGLYIAGVMDPFFLIMRKKERKRIKNFAVIKNAGHICNIDRYEKVNNLMIQFQETGLIASE